MTLNTENSKDSTKELLEIRNEFSEVVGYKKNQYKHLLCFNILIINYQKEELKKFSFTISSKRKPRY